MVIYSSRALSRICWHMNPLVWHASLIWAGLETPLIRKMIYRAISLVSVKEHCKKDNVLECDMNLNRIYA